MVIGGIFPIREAMGLRIPRDSCGAASPYSFARTSEAAGVSDTGGVAVTCTTGLVFGTRVPVVNFNPPAPTLLTGSDLVLEAFLANVLEYAERARRAKRVKIFI